MRPCTTSSPSHASRKEPGTSRSTDSGWSPAPPLRPKALTTVADCGPRRFRSSRLVGWVDPVVRRVPVPVDTARCRPVTPWPLPTLAVPAPRCLARGRVQMYQNWHVTLLCKYAEYKGFYRVFAPFGPSGYAAGVAAISKDFQSPLARALRARGVSLSQLLSATGCSHSTAQRMLCGEGGATLRTARRLVHAFPWLNYETLAEMLYGRNER